jgi:hypothetical protein
LVHSYKWESTSNEAGFLTEVREFSDSCDAACTVLDGGRYINKRETFELANLNTQQDLLLVTRLHTLYSGTLDIFANGQYVDTQIITEQPGNLNEISTIIPANLLSSTTLIEIIPTLAQGFYIPYYHAAYQINFQYPENTKPILAVYQNTNFSLIFNRYSIENHLLRDLSLYIETDWFSDGHAEGDYRRFVHLYDNINQPPLAQSDGYVTGFKGFANLENPLPPGNWLPGTISDRIRIDINHVPPGTYSVAIGFYNPQTGERLVPTSDRYEVSPDGRLWLGEVTIGDEAEDIQD